MTSEKNKSTLVEIGAGPDNGIDLVAGGLALAGLDRPQVALDYYTEHLSNLADATRALVQPSDSSAQSCARILQEIIAEENRYGGDRLTYDDLQNANLMRVIDRRRGLPVALGILYIHIGRTMGWKMRGLAFPGHFLIQLDSDGERVIIDPFNGGQQRNASDLRELIKTMTNSYKELRPTDYAPVSDREILLRLQNNIKFRHMQMRDANGALRTINTMLLFAPDVKLLWWESGALNLELGNLQTAAKALDEYLIREDDEDQKLQAAALIQKLRKQLN
ncbi:MAG: SirB1 family protein [Alphaproteobacteria bacterium]